MKDSLKKYLIISISLAFVLCFSGCFPSGETSNKNVGSFDQSQVPLNMKETLADNLLIDAKININGDLNWKKFNVDFKDLNYEKFINKLLEHRKITDIDEGRGQSKNEKNAVSYSFDDKSFLYTDIERISYSSGPRYNDRSYAQIILSTSGFIRPDLAKVYNKDKLENLDKENSISLVKQQLTTLGIEFNEEPTVYALDHATMMSEWEDYLMPDGTYEKKWTKDEEAYVIMFQETINNLPLTESAYRDIIGHDVYGGRIMGVVSKYGLINLEIQSVYEPTAEQNVDKLISFNSAVELLKEKYKDIILTDPVTVSNVALELVPIKDQRDESKISLIPAYVFTANQRVTTSKEGFEDVIDDASFNIFFDAETGNEIAVGMAI